MPRLLITLFAVIILHSSFFNPHCLAETTWQSIGPFGGGGLAIAIDPNNSQTVYAGTYKTTNGGASWAAVSSELSSVKALAIDPANSQTVYALADRIIKSIDGGASWITANIGITDSIDSIAIAPTDSQTLYAWNRYGSKTLFKTTNGGASWTTANNSLTYISTYDGKTYKYEILSFAIDPGDSQTIYAGTRSSGVFKSTNGGASWTTATSGILPDPYGYGHISIFSLAVAKTDNKTVYANTYYDTYISTNSGATWTAKSITTVNSGILSGESTLAIDPADSQTVYTGGYEGIFKSVNGGTSWTRLTSGSDFVNKIAIDPTNSKTVYASMGMKGVYKSTNGGTSWTAANHGITGTIIKAIGVAPGNSKMVYAQSDYLGFFKSNNGGATWTATGAGGSSAIMSPLLFVDPTNSQIVYSMGSDSFYKSTDGTTSWAEIPGIGMSTSSGGVRSLAFDRANSQTIFAGTGNGVLKSINGGATWAVTDNGITGKGIRSFAIDPANSQTIYAFIHALCKSIDGGSTWTVMNGGVSQMYSYSTPIVVDRTNSQTVYVGTNTGVLKSTDGGVHWFAANSGFQDVTDVNVLIQSSANSQLIFAATEEGKLYKSTNRGESWLPVSTAPELNMLKFIVSDPKDVQTLYAVTHAGFYKSIDGGTSWAAVNAGQLFWSVNSLVIDHTDSQTAYVGGSGGVYKSLDGGASWAAASNGMPNNTEVLSLAIDPNDNKTFYAKTSFSIYKSTNGGGSWLMVKSFLSSLDSFDISPIVVDPTNSKTIYLTTPEGLYASADSGKSWASTNSGFAIQSASAGPIAFDPSNVLTVYTGADSASGDGTGGTLRSIYKSINGGASWTPADNGMPVQCRVISLVIDPSNSKTVYAGTFGSSNGTVIPGVYKSTDGGTLWKAASNGIPSGSHVSSLIIDPVNSQKIYALTGQSASTFNTGIYLSTNGGTSWTEFSSGISSQFRINSIAINPADGNELYAATDGGGILKAVSSSTPAILAPASASFNIGVPGSFTVTASGWPAPTLSVSGLPNGLAFDPATGLVRGTPLLGSTGTYTPIFTASNGLPPDAAKAVTIAVLPSSVLNIAITAPTTNATATALTSITGTASGSGLSRVEIQVTDGTYYLQGTGSFTTTPAWLTASGTTSWLLPTATATWVEGITYNITARANNSKTATASFRIQPSEAKQPAILSAAFTPDTIKAGESATLAGLLVRTDTTALAGKTVTIIITPPATAAEPNPAPVISTVITNSSGAFNGGPLSVFATAGIYMVQIRFDGDASCQAVSQSLSLPVVAQSGYAIIVVGKTAGTSSDLRNLLDLHTKTATSINNTLITKRGFLDSNITALVSSASAAVTKQQIQSAISAMKAKYAASPAPFYLIMVGHGSSGANGGFLLGGQTLAPAELSSWLDDFEAGAAAATLDANKRFLIVGSCYSGLFQSLAKDNGRIIVTSAGSEEQSLAGSVNYDGNSAALSGGDYFLDTFFNFLGRGDNFKDAYSQAATAVALRDPRKVPLALHSGIVDTLAQHPLLEDNGTGGSTYGPTGGNDGAVAGTRYLGEGDRVPAAGNPTDITTVDVTQNQLSNQILDPNTATATLQLWVNDNSRVGKAWVEVRTPNTTATGSGTGQVIPSSLDSMPLIYDGVKWIGDYNSFTTPGRYDIYYYTRDIQTDDISPMAHSTVYRQKTVNTAPGSFSLILPEDLAPTAPLFPLAWQESADSDGLTYTLQVATDQNFTNIVYTKENITQAVTSMPEGALKNPANNQYYCQNRISYCYWKVTAVDTFGATTGSDTRSFTITQTNSLPSLLYGSVRNSATGAPITTATVQLGTAPAEPVMPNGYYLLMADATGTAKTLKISATGYSSTSVNATLTPGAVYENNILLIPGTNITKPGDCNGDGAVTIAEVQSAINMFLGLKTVESCVDTDGVGGVSIAVVQKVINNFLEL